jgi:hypothetical protein
VAFKHRHQFQRIDRRFAEIVIIRYHVGLFCLASDLQDSTFPASSSFGEYR